MQSMLYNLSNTVEAQTWLIIAHWFVKSREKKENAQRLHDLLR